MAASLRSRVRPTVVECLLARECGAAPSSLLARRLHGHRAMVERLELVSELQGHHGCVNRIAYDETGSVLASVSDDCQCVLWDAHSFTQRLAFPTGHEANVFGVAPLPYTDCRTIATGAMDTRVRLHTIDDAGRVESQAFHCHNHRVKQVITSGERGLFFTVSEDGSCRQYDTRAAHVCQPREAGESRCANVMVRLMGRRLKSIAICPGQPQYVAVACDDSTVRLFDRRRLHTPGRDHDPVAVRVFCPQALSEQRTRCHITGVAFNSHGSEILANYNGHNMYLFGTHDIDGAQPHRMDFVRPAIGDVQAAAGVLKEEGNKHFKAQHYTDAITAYTQSLEEAENAVVYTNRAAALMKRLAPGDCWAALRDTDAALELDPTNVKAHYRRVLALEECGRTFAALEAAEASHARFPTNEDLDRKAKELAATAVPKAVAAIDKWRTQRAGRQPADDAPVIYDDAALRVSRDARGVSLHTVAVAAPEHHVSVFRQRYVGHCNGNTDIKDAAFWGPDDAYVLCGSDDGRFFVYEKQSGQCALVLSGDNDIVNCIQVNPSISQVAVSGIDHTIKMWMPLSEARWNNPLFDSIVEENVRSQREEAGMGNISMAQMLAMLQRHAGRT